MNPNCSKFPTRGYVKIGLFTDTHLHIKSADFHRIRRCVIHKIQQLLSLPSVFMIFLAELIMLLASDKDVELSDST